jgi:CheY-like chemotaxis protein
VSKEVLIVEDDRALAQGLERAIGAEGYQVRVVHDGQAALDAIAARAPAVVLLDLLVPKKDGHTVLEALRASPKTRELPVVVMTGVFRGREHQRKLEKAGAQGFLEKPFKKSDVMSQLRRYLGRPGPRPGEIDPSQELFSLAEVPMAEVLWRAVCEQLTGSVVFECGKRRKAILLDDGKPTKIRSNIARECLGNRLLAAGRIDQATLDESLRRARQGEGRQGEILVKLGKVTQAEVDAALAGQYEEKLYDLFGWPDGEAQLQRTRPDPTLTSDLPAWSPQLMILRGVQHMNRRRIEAILEPYRDQVLLRGSREPDPEIASEPAVVAVRRAVEAGTALSALPAEQLPTLYALRLFGVIRLGEGDAEATTTPSIVLARSESSSPDEAELRERIARAGLNHFEVLGVSIDPTDDEVRAAFLRLAKRYHPDRCSDPALRALAGEVFQRISEAHETLSDPRVRSEYMRGLQKGKLEAGGKPAVAQIMAAETHFNDGVAHYRRREYPQAYEKLKNAVELNPQEGEFRALFGLVHYLLNRSDGGAERVASEHFEAALELAPRSANAHYYCGLLRKACGDPGEAERMFRAALDLAPNHAEATRELRVLGMRRDKGRGESGEGLLGKLPFGRKKK